MARTTAPAQAAQAAADAVLRRAKLRERVGVEHRPAHLANQGRRARYRGVRKNLFDLRRACAIQNLETIPAKGRVMRSLSNRSVF